MATDPRKFLVKQCGSSVAKGVGKDTARKDFFNSLGKVGDIELLNNSALGGDVGKGLRDLTKISDSIRVGGNPSSAIPKNGTDVLIATGISQASAAKAGTFNPGVLNKATAAADQIADQVQNGQFSLSNIPNSFTDIQNLSTLVDGIFTNTTGKDEEMAEVCQASPYAMDLIAYAPKYKFLFVVEFIFTDPFVDTLDGKSAAFVIKNTTRPNVNFEHEEVNMYNFWVKIPKRTVYEPMTMRFYDDNNNAAMHLYETYLKAISPIANLSFPAMMEDKPGSLEAQSMGFNAPNQKVHGGLGDVATRGYSASMGPVSNSPDVKNVFKRINIYHVYDYGRYMNQYKFLNPKIQSMELDELDMAENGNGSELMFQFAYDAVHITTDVNVQIHGGDLATKTAMGLYPLEPNFGGKTNPTPAPGEGDPDEGGGFFSGLGAVAGAATGAVSGVLDFGTGVVSDAFTATSNFAGSIFSDFSAGASAAEASVKNSINGNSESSK